LPEDPPEKLGDIDKRKCEGRILLHKRSQDPQRLLWFPLSHEHHRVVVAGLGQ